MFMQCSRLKPCVTETLFKYKQHFHINHVLYETIRETQETKRDGKDNTQTRLWPRTSLATHSKTRNLYNSTDQNQQLNFLFKQFI